MTTPFVYILRDVVNGKRYGGVKFAKGCKPSDILTKYFTSSKQVKHLISEGREFVVDKIIEFESKEDAMEFEELLLLTTNAHLSVDWYNQSAGKAINPDTVKATSQLKYGVDNWMQSNAGIEWARDRMIGNQITKGHKRSAETKHKMSIAFTGRVFSDEHKEKIRQNRIGTKASEEVRNKMSEDRTRGKHARSIPIHTPDGVFECINDAADFYGITGRGISRRVKSNRFPEYYRQNTTAAEVTTDDSIDPDSTGFIVNQVAATNINVTSATYIYLAMA